MSHTLRHFIPRDQFLACIYNSLVHKSREHGAFQNTLETSASMTTVI